MNHFCNNSVLMATVVYVIGIAFALTALTWINKLEETKCQCSQDYKRDYIKYYMYAYIGIYTFFYLNTLFMAFGYGIDCKKPYIGKTLFTLNVVMSIFSIINIVFSIQYIWNLKEKNCKCSEDIRREIYYVLNWISVALIGLSMILGVIAAISFVVLIARTRQK